MARQLTLFDNDPEPWEQDDKSLHLIAEVVLVAGPDKVLDYTVPAELADRLTAGCRVEVPLGKGNRRVVGYCVGVATRRLGSRKLKPIRGIVDAQSLLTPAMLRLTRWIADRYLCPWARVLETVLPAGVRGQAGTRLTTLLSVDGEARKILDELKLTTKQRTVVGVLLETGRPMTPGELARAANCTAAPITTLRRKGILRSRTSRVQTLVESAPLPERQAHLTLNEDQQRVLDEVLDALRGSRYETLLLHGVTGSGKTEVYIQAIDEVIHYGRQAIVLVPEISLTPQTVDRFRNRFGEVAVLHSHLTDAERHRYWQQIVNAQVQVIVGARSAIFAPTPHLGLIVLDEEHESSFKQGNAPHYHTRDVAVERARAESIPLILGSATPSLESWHRAQTGEYKLLSMPRRVSNLPMPAVATIDLRDDSQRRGTRGAISRKLHMAIGQAIGEGGQVILLLNRRGYSTHVQCPACGRVWNCPDCDIALTHHLTERRVVCHYCDYEQPEPDACDQCQFRGLRFTGTGTQKLEAEIRAKFPAATCLRMDTDTMRGRGAHQDALSRFRTGEVQILLGTQMIAKGLDFPNVTLVGVINADTALHLPDFRAAERTFHLVTQVAGRTGRGERGGRVLVQTLSPEHPAIHAATRHDYVAFASGELPLRQMLHYPPFTQMIRLVIRGESDEKTLEFSKEFASRIDEVAKEVARKDREQADEGKDEPADASPPERDTSSGSSSGPSFPPIFGSVLGGLGNGSASPTAASTHPVKILGPAPAPLARLHGKFRFHIQVQSADGDGLRQIVRRAIEDLKTPSGVEWIVDVDPINML